MILWILDFFSHAKIPAVFFYLSTRMILAAFTSLTLTLILIPYFIAFLKKRSLHQILRTKEEVGQLADLHQKKEGTPTMGGVVVLFSMLVSLVLWMDFGHVFTWILLIATLWLGSIGFIDDFMKFKQKNSRGLRGKKKLFLQLLLALFVSGYLLIPSMSSFMEKNFSLHAPVVKEQVASHGKDVNGKVLTQKEYVTHFYIPFDKKPFSIYPIFLLFLFLFVVLGSSNAVNLSDGLDGLASGLLILVSLVLALFAFFSNHLELARYLNILYIEGSGEIAIFLFALAGAMLGFLWYNCNPAEIFLGDTGSLALGGILGISAILLRRELLFALIGAIFVLEALSVILQVASYRLRNKKRIFLCTPLHHHFEYKGWAENKVVMRFWILGLFFALLGIASIKFQ